MHISTGSVTKISFNTMFGYEISGHPEVFSGTTVFARFVDGLAFRYHWATEGLRPEDYAFRPSRDSMSLLELQKHMLHLVFMIKQTVFDADERERFASEDPDVLREAILQNLRAIREHLDELSDDRLATHEVLRRSGARSRYCCRMRVNPAMPEAAIVLTGPAEMALTRMFSGPKSLDR